MYLVARIYINLEICYDEGPTHPQEPIVCDNGPTFSLESLLSPHLALQLQRSRAEKQEAARVAREAQNAQIFHECERNLEASVLAIAHEVLAKKNRRKCTLQYLQSVVAGLERTLLEVKGLNQVGAGRRCQ